MTEHNREFNNVEPHVSPQFRKDLRALFEPPGAVPQQVDKTIADMAKTRLRESKHGTPRRLIVPVRWAAVAAAAVIVLGTILYTTVTHNKPQSAIHNPKSVGPGLAEGRADIDGNGRVDILDAFRLARDVESRGQAEMKWDLNGDGVVDHKDVDLVAFAAVRLDKGV